MGCRRAQTRDSRAALRLDRLLNQETDHTPAEARRFLETWATRMRAVYMAVSFRIHFCFPLTTVAISF